MLCKEEGELNAIIIMKLVRGKVDMKEELKLLNE